MKTQYTLLIGLFILGVLSFTNCKNKSNPELASINLLRGELILCSSEQFGDVSFSLSCNYDTRETFDLAVSLLHSFEYEGVEPKLCKLNLKNFIDEWRSTYVQKLINKSQTLHVDINDDIIILTDKEILGRIMNNLLTNAIKFS